MRALPLATQLVDVYPAPNVATLQAALLAQRNTIADLGESPELDLASAATCDVGGQNSSWLRITGTSGITNLGSNYRGAVVLRFAAALAITHNATSLICPNGVSRTTAAGDVYLAYPKATAGVADGWMLVPLAAALTPAAGQCQLQFVSTSSLKLMPFNGNKLSVNGVVCTVPDAGATLAAAPAAANTNYYIYAVATAGVITSLEASTTARATDTTAGNNGVQIKSGDSTRSLVGLARGNASATWADNSVQRFVRSWFNDKGIEGDYTLTGNTVAGYTSWAELSRIEAVFWADEKVKFSAGYTFQETVVATCIFYGGVGINSSTVATGHGFVGGANGVNVACAGTAGAAVKISADSYNFFSMLIGASAWNTPYALGGFCGCEYMSVRP